VIQAGFQTQDVKDIQVEAGKIFNLKVTLAVASSATQVEVSANAIAIETSSSALTSVIPTKGNYRHSAQWPRFYAVTEVESRS